MNEFKRASNEFKAQIEQEISNLEVEQRQTILPPSPPPEGATSRTLNVGPSEVVVADAHTDDAHAPEVPASQAASDDEPLFASGDGARSNDPSPGATEAASSSDAITSPTSQESHV